MNNTIANETLVECLARIARHDESGLEDLYDATSRKVYGVALRVLGNVECAEEVVSDLYLQVWRKPGGYDPQRGSVATWLLMSCRSRALDALRARLRRGGGPCGESEEPVAEGADPQDLLQASQRDATIHASLSLLAPLQRQLIALAFFRGYSHAEIATATGMPLGTVKTTLRSAIGHLRAELTGRSRTLSA